MQGAAAAQAQAPSSAERNVLLGGGGRGPPRPCKPGRPSLELIYCGPKASSFRQPGCSLGRRHDSPRAPPPAPTPPPPGPSRPPPADPLTAWAKVGEGLPVGVRGCRRSPHRPARTRCGAPSPLPLPLPSSPPPLPPSPLPPGPPARSLPLSPGSITQKLVKLVPDSWRRAPLQERKKEKEKGKKPARGTRGRGRKRSPWSHTAPRSPVLPPPTLLGNPHPGGQGARATLINYLWARINYSAAPGRGGRGKAEELEGGCGDHPA